MFPKYRLTGEKANNFQRAESEPKVRKKSTINEQEKKEKKLKEIRKIKLKPNFLAYKLSFDKFEQKQGRDISPLN